jgi:TM2 domain-containing membrane protein YozV
MVYGTVLYAEDTYLLYNDFTPEKITSFTCSLIDKGEYYRAYAELLRLNSYYPEYLKTSVYAVTSNYLFYKSKNYNDLLEFDFPEKEDGIFIPVSLFRVDSLIKLNRKSEAESLLAELYGREDSIDYSGYLIKRSIYLSLLNNKTTDGDDKFKSQFPGYNELFNYSKSVNEGRKNPYLGALAGVIPGAGYIYAGEKGTGIVSMIVIGAGSAVSYGAYRSSFDSLAVISGVITFFFYGGSIAGGYMQSVKYNDRLMDTLEMRLNRELLPERDIEEIYFKFGLNSNDCR